MSHIYLKVPESHPIEVASEFNAGSPQLIRFYYSPPEAPPPDHRVLAWEAGWGGGGEGLVLPPRSLTTVTGELALGTWHWNQETNNWEFNTTRVRMPVDSPGTNTPGVRETDPVASTNARASLIVEAEDGGGDYADWNDVILTLSWPGRVVGVLSWTNDPTKETKTNWPQIDVFKHAHVYLDSVIGGVAQIRFLGTGGEQDLVRGRPVVVPRAQAIQVVTRGAGAVSCVARIVDRA